MHMNVNKHMVYTSVFFINIHNHVYTQKPFRNLTFDPAEGLKFSLSESLLLTEEAVLSECVA